MTPTESTNGMRSDLIVIVITMVTIRDTFAVAVIVAATDRGAAKATTHKATRLSVTPWRMLWLQQRHRCRHLREEEEEEGARASTVMGRWASCPMSVLWRRRFGLQGQQHLPVPRQQAVSLGLVFTVVVGH